MKKLFEYPFAVSMPLMLMSVGLGLISHNNIVSYFSGLLMGCGIMFSLICSHYKNKELKSKKDVVK